MTCGVGKLNGVSVYCTLLGFEHGPPTQNINNLKPALPTGWYYQHLPTFGLWMFETPLH